MTFEMFEGHLQKGEFQKCQEGVVEVFGKLRDHFKKGENILGIFC